MGCDIHSFTEAKIDGKWEVVDKPEIDRWYDLFGIIAGVRNGFAHEFIEPRGIPYDASKVVDVFYQSWEGDAHSASWLTLDELKQTYQRLEIYYISERGMKIEYFEDVFGWNFIEFENMFKEIRIVFWFDN